MSLKQKVAQVVSACRALSGARTPNTRNLDQYFSPSQEYGTVATLGKSQLEWLGAELLEAAKRKGHFVAITPSKLENGGWYEHAAEKGFLVVETLPGDVTVISPSYEMALRMYDQDRFGNTPATRRLSEKEIRGTPLIGDLVDKLHAH